MKKILIIAAHPDDDAIGCAGTIMKHIANSDIVYVLFMTNGVSSRDAYDIANRKSSTKKACDIMGVRSYKNLDLPDNMMDTMPLLDITKLIEKEIENIKPEIIYTHHVGDLNIDHQVTHKAVITASRPLPYSSVKEIYAFEILSSTEWQSFGQMPFFPNVYVDIRPFFDRKLKVLEAYADEMRNPPHSRSIENIARLSLMRGNSVGLDYAEAFSLVRMIK